MATPHTTNNIPNASGFTLVEMTVSIALFGLLVGMVFQLFTSGFVAQRSTLGIQESANQVSFVAEYAGRALRQAQKELEAVSADQCLKAPVAGRGWNYEVSASNDSITFIDKDGVCRRFLLSSGQVMEQTAAGSLDPHLAANLGASQALTPSGMAVTSFRIVQQGADQQDDLQPRVTLVLEAEGETGAKVRVQTTISQRTFDVAQQ